MNLSELMAKAGISSEDLKEFISPIIGEVVSEKLNETIISSLEPFIDTLRQQMNTQISVRVTEAFNALGFDKFDPNKLAEDIKKMSDEKMEKFLAEAKTGKASGDGGSSKATISDEIKMKWMDKLVNKVLGTDEEELTKVAERFRKTTDAMSNAAISLGYSPPNPMMIYRIYMDAFAKNYAALMRAGAFPGGSGFPLPIVDHSKKGSSSLSHQSEPSKSGKNTTNSVFDQFL